MSIHERPLHKAILRQEQPKHEVADSIIGIISADTRIEFGETEIEIGENLLALNALILSRNDPPKLGEELKHEVEASITTPRFRRQLGRVAAMLEEATGESLVEVQGDRREFMTFRLSRRLKLIDNRDTPHPDPLASLRPHAMEGAQIGQNLQRKKVFENVLHKYSKDPRIQRSTSKLEWQYAESIRTRHLPYEEWPTNKECASYFSQIETCIEAVLNPQSHLEDVLPLIHDAIIAYQTLYIKHIPLVDSLAAKYSTGKKGRYEENFQRGTLILLDFILEYPSFSLNDPDIHEESFSVAALYILSKRMNLSLSSPVLVGGRITNVLYARQRNIQHAIDLFRHQFRQKPSHGQLAKLLGLTELQVADALGQPISPATKETPEEMGTVQEIKEELLTILEEELFSDQEKVVLSLRYGLFIPSLRGIVLYGKNGHMFTYPYSEADMPSQKAMSALQIASFLGIRLDRINSLLEVGLSKGRRIFKGKGIETLDEW